MITESFVGRCRSTDSCYTFFHRRFNPREIPVSHKITAYAKQKPFPVHGKKISFLYKEEMTCVTNVR